MYLGNNVQFDLSVCTFNKNTDLAKPYFAIYFVKFAVVKMYFFTFISLVY